MPASLPAPSKWDLPLACGPCWVSENVCAFRIWAPHGENVRVEVENVETVPLQRDGDFWSGELKGAVPGSRYRVVLGSTWNDCFNSEGAELVRRDPCAREADFNSNWCILPALPSPPSLLPPGATPTFNQLVMYEIHVGSFVTKSDEHRAFAATTERLEHISNLGFNCIQLMPTTEFGGIWGYNSRMLLATHGPWGSADDLRGLLRRAHELGLVVLADVVLNHGSSKMNSLWNWDGFGPDNCGGIYFEGEKDTPWGKRFSFHKAEVKEYLKQACRVWIEEYGFDGLRFDSVHNMPWGLLQEMTHSLKQHYPDKILIAEITPENPKAITDAGFHSCWIHSTHFDSVKIMKKFDGGEDPGRRIGMLKSMVSLYRGFPTACSGVNSVLGSHDQIGDRHDGKDDGGKHRYYISRLGGRENWHGRAQCRAWFAFQNCCRGIPMTFMGTETLQNDWWHVDDHHRMNWGIVDGGDAHAAGMMQLVTASNKLRTTSPALHGDETKFVHEDGNNTVLGFVRHSGDEALLCIMHLAESQWEKNDYGINTGWGGGRKWQLCLNSQAASFGGWEGSATQEVVADNEGKIHISIPKWSLLIFKAV